MAVGTAGLLVCIAAALAQVRTPPQIAVAASTASTTGGASNAAAGARAFQRLGCANCHLFRGIGDPGMPLDGIDRRMDRAAIRDAASGTGAVAEKLSLSLARRKARVLSDPDFELLIDYLAGDPKAGAPPPR